MRAVIFTDFNLAATAKLVEATLRLAWVNHRIEVCGIVTSRPESFRRTLRRAPTRYARAALVASVNADLRYQWIRPQRLDLARLRRRRDLPVLVPVGGDPNAAAFRERLTKELRPDVALTYYVGSIFRRPLLDSFEQVVNYHDSLLPKYRGLGATSFSIYDGEEQTGFSFHRMTAGIDAGPILVQGALPLDESVGFDQVNHQKIAAAVDALPRVLALIAANDSGRQQEEPSSYRSASDVRAVRYVDDPELWSADELHRRVRAFGTAYLKVGHRHYPVTRLRDSSARSALAFRTADGQTLAPDRFRYLPRAAYEAGRGARAARALLAGRASQAVQPGT